MAVAMQLGPKFADAVTFAIESHVGQERKGGGTPYIAHPIAVAALVVEDGGSEDQAIAAILHDTVEDCANVFERTIRERFGDQAADLVMWCTKLSQSEEFVRSRVGAPPEPLTGKREFVWRIRQPEFPSAALTVAIADKYHNASTILADLALVGEGVWRRFSATRDETLEYYEGLAEAFGERARQGFGSRWLDPLRSTVDSILAGRDR